MTRRVMDESARTIGLTYEIVPGPRAAIVVEGYTLSGSALKRIETAWTHAVVDQFLIDEATAIARAELADSGFVLPSITAAVERRSDEKHLRLRIEPGPRAAARTVEFSGNQQIDSDRLRKTLSDGGLDQAVWLEPDRVRDALSAVYREAGYREATVRADPVAMVGDTATRPVRIDEGRLFRLRTIRVDGAHGLTDEEIRRVAALSQGDVFTEARTEKARIDLDTAYRKRGFNAAGVTVEATPVTASAEVDVTIEVDEGPQQRLRDIETTGLHRVRPEIVSQALKLNVGEPIDLAAWNNARKRLYETGAFRSVDIEREVIQPAEPPSGDSGTVMEQPVRAKVSVQEWPFMRLRYGVDVEDEPAPTTGSAAVSAESSDGRTFGLGVAADLGVRHLFGRTLSAGVAGRYSGDFSAVRLYTTTPVTFGRPITSNVYFERSREEVGTTEDGGPETLSYESTLTFEQRIRPSRRTEISYRYSLEEDTDVDPVTRVESQSQFTGMVASTALLDGRNDLVNPTGGWFHSSTIEYAPHAFGSTVPFTKYLLSSGSSAARAP